MLRQLLVFAILGACLCMAAGTASAEPALRSVANQDELAPTPPSLSRELDQAFPGDQNADAHEPEAYILHCCPPPRGYTPIKCDPSAYNCFRAMNHGIFFPLGTRW